jgi:hypothetical protein
VSALCKGWSQHVRMDLTDRLSDGHTDNELLHQHLQIVIALSIKKLHRVTSRDSDTLQHLDVYHRKGTQTWDGDFLARLLAGLVS